MPKYDVTVVIHFDIEAPNSTEAKGRIVDMKIHKVLRPAAWKCGAQYTRRELITCRRLQTPE